MRLHEQLRVLRGSVAQAELARRAGIPRARLAEFEKGGNITVVTLEKLAAVLGLQIELRRRPAADGDIRETLVSIMEEARRALATLDDDRRSQTRESTLVADPELPPLPESPSRFPPAVTASDPTVRKLLDDDRREREGAGNDDDDEALQE